MNYFSAYTLIIAGSVIIIISYFFNVVAKRTNIPSVLMLILLGVGIKIGIEQAGVPDINFFPILEILGIVGVIMIVLEAALDLELKKEKWPIIWKSFSIALLSLMLCSFFIALIIKFFFAVNLYTSLLYALPLSIMSSAIIIPSVENLSVTKKEFMIYESTFSDILGIMTFYFLLGSVETSSVSELTWKIVGNIFITILISILVSYILIIMFQKLSSPIKLFLLIAILFLLYSIGKLMHLSSLIMILMFGLVMQNRSIFFRGFLKKHVNCDAMDDIYKNFKLVTLESSFIIRTFFFVIFGMSIILTSLLSIKVILISGIVLGILFGIRILLLLVFDRKDIIPQVFLAPRGLITILLFYSIPAEYSINNFSPGILLFVILVSSSLMAWALISHKKSEKIKQEIEHDFPYNHIEGNGDSEIFKNENKKDIQTNNTK